MREILLRHLEPVIGRVRGIAAAAVVGSESTLVSLGRFADHERPTEDQWEIASITKVFTSLLLAEMAAAGELGFTDPIGLYLPEPVAARLPSPDRQPTLEDLSTHTAGFPSLPPRLLGQALHNPDPYRDLTEGQVFACLGRFTRRPSRPRFHYSNFGAGLLGHLLARAGGQPFEELLKRRVLAPLGMHQTRVDEHGAEGSTTVVRGYRRGRPTPPWTFGSLAGCGALRSTIGNLVQFARACLRPPSAPIGAAIVESRREQRPGPLVGSPSAIGLGWLIRRWDGHEATWHNGGTYGTSSFLAVDSRRSLAVIALGTAGPRFVPPLDGACWSLLDDLGRH